MKTAHRNNILNMYTDHKYLCLPTDAHIY